MGKKPCFSKVDKKKGPWTSQEDKTLKDSVRIHGEGKWRDLAQKSGLKRCGKCCRLRWLNYLRPDIKLGNISEDEEDLIIRLHRLLGNRWTLIAGRLPGRSGNEIKNYWKTTLSKKLLAQNNDHQLDARLEEKKSEHQPQLPASTSTSAAMQLNDPKPEAKSAKTVFNPSEQQNGDQVQHHNKGTDFLWEYNASISSLLLKENDGLVNFWVDSEICDGDAMDKNIQPKEHDSEDVGTLGHYGFTSDNFSQEP